MAALPPLDPLLHAQLRLAIMSLLMSEETADFKYLKAKTNATAGNLSVQLNKLKDAGYLTVHKTFRDNYPHTEATITEAGKDAFEKYVQQLQQYLKP